MSKRKPSGDPTPKRRRRQLENEREDDDDGGDEEMVPTALTRKIISQARAQQEEEEEREEQQQGGGASSSAGASQPRRGVSFAPAPTAFDDDDDDDDDDGQQDGDDEDNEEGGEYYEVEDVELDESDERALDLFMGNRAPQTLADIIMEKIAQHEESAEARAGGGGGGAADEAPMPELPPKVIEVYQGVGKLLSTYRSGKLPKAFKIIPQLTNWEEVLYCTAPEDWTPAAMREATKLFASNMNPRMAQRFFNLVLLPAVQDDIRSNKKLNFHLYLSLKKCLYKPAAFFKGVLLPLGESRCTLREALIVSSVLAKVSVPVLHSAVAILKLTEMPFCGANALFLRTLLLKKYALPYRVLDELVSYFAAFAAQRDEELTLLWHQCLLSFAQHYKTEITHEQKQQLKALMRVHAHGMVTPEIRRELFSARNRGDPFVASLAGDEQMVDA